MGLIQYVFATSLPTTTNGIFIKRARVSYLFRPHHCPFAVFWVRLQFPHWKYHYHHEFESGCKKLASSSSLLVACCLKKSWSKSALHKNAVCDQDFFRPIVHSFSEILSKNAIPNRTWMGALRLWCCSIGFGKVTQCFLPSRAPLLVLARELQGQLQQHSWPQRFFSREWGGTHGWKRPLTVESLLRMSSAFCCAFFAPLTLFKCCW